GPQGLHFRRRVFRLRPVLAAAGSDPRAGRGGHSAASGSDLAETDRMIHLQQQHGGIQTGVVRSPCECGQRLPDELLRLAVPHPPAALASSQSDKLPWGKKAFFDRARFDLDLKRIQAFYADRGYPDARVTSFDVQPNDKQDSVDITLTISEGQPVKVAAIDFIGFDDVIPPAHFATLKNRIPLKIGRP